MSPRVEPVNPLDHPRWDDQLLASGDNSFFHSAGWARVLAESYGYRPVYFAAMAGGRITLLVPLMEVRSVLTGTRGVSLPFSDFCEPFIDGACHMKREVLEGIIAAGRKAGWRSVELRDGSYVPDTEPSSRFRSHKLDVTRGESVIFSGLRDSTRRNIGKARKSGLQLRMETSYEAMKEFYRLNCLTRRMHGLPPQPISFFKNIVEHVFSKRQGFVLLARLNGRAVAGSVFFHFGKRAIYKYGASDERFRHCRPNNLVMWEAIKWYSANGFEWLSFGRTEAGNEGLNQFKSGWGVIEGTIEYLKYDLRADKFVSEAQSGSGLLALISRKLPLSVLKVAGRALYRHMG